MVTTRSGKPVVPSSKGVGLKSRTKPASTVFIFEEPTIKAETKKRESPCKNTVSELKKSKTQSSFVDKENVLNVNIVQPPSSLQSEPKKIQISQDEKLMSGAPEGDLFDMVVFEDSELWPFASNDEATEEFAKCIKIHDESTVWADQYESVVVVRRVVLHHASILNSSLPMLLEASKAIIAGVESLRSCRVRSGIMGLRTLLRNCGPTLSTMLTAEGDPCAAVVTSLLTKTGGGPKFISELALNSLLQEAVAGVPPLELIRCLFPSITHRNPDIGASAIYASVECLGKIDPVVLSDASTEGVQTMRETVQGLAQGLNAKRPKAKDSAKTALRTLCSAVGDAHFECLLKTHLSESQIGEVTRALGSSAAATPCTPSPQVGHPLGSASRGMPSGTSLAMAMSVSNAKFARKPLVHPSSAQGPVNSVSKFKMHMMASSVKSSSGDVIADIVATPARSSVAPPASTASSTTGVRAEATPVLSMREHILMMKKQRAAQAATPLSVAADASVLVLEGPMVSAQDSAQSGAGTECI